MSSATLHIIAAITMLIDHIGCFIFPSQLWLRIIGRIAFPIYALMIAEGFHHTRSRKKYLLRLGILAVISQIPLIWLSLILHVPSSPNVLFGFCAAMLVLEIVQYGPLTYPIALVAAVGAHLIGVDYGAVAVLMPVCFYAVRNMKPIYRCVCEALIILTTISFQLLTDPWGATIYMLLAIPFVALYNGKKGRFSVPKWLRYGFYPAHLLAIAIIVAIIHR